MQITTPASTRLPAISDGMRTALRALAPAVALCGLAEWFIVDAVVRALRAPGEIALFGQAGRHFVAGLLLTHLAYGHLLDRCARLTSAHTAARVQQTLAGVAKLDLAAFERLVPGAFVARLTTDVELVRGFSAGLARLLRAGAALVVALGYCHALSPAAALIAAASMGIVGVVIIVAQLRRGGRARRLVEQRDAVQRLVEDAIEGFAQLRQHRPRSDAIAAEVRRRSAALDAERDGVVSTFVEAQARGRYLLYGAMAITAWTVTHLEGLPPHDAAPITLVVMYAGLTQLVATRLMPAGLDAWDAWQRLRASAVELPSLPDAPPEAAAIDEALPARPTRLDLRDVSYARPPTGERDGFVMGPVDLTLRAGEIVFVTGENGSGKSTFLKVLTGLYRADRGALAVDGVAVSPATMPAYRALFATIFSDFTLFDRIYGVDAIDPARVQALLDELDLSHKTAFVDGRFTELDLSTGQRKRLAMVAALLRDRPIHVFDEWSAEQDPEHREWFHRTLLPRLAAAGSIVVAVTHDAAFFDVADRVVHFDLGRVEVR